jgi:REP element-mobilizing transposase RayT
MTRSYVNVWIHAVWAVKNREPLLKKSLRVSLFKHVHETVRKKEIYVDCINGIEDHTHVLFSLKSTQTIANVLKEIKGESSKWLNDNGFIEGPFEWQEGYGAYSVSPSALQRVRSYISNQEKHHRTRGFEEEMKEFEWRANAED